MAEQDSLDQQATGRLRVRLVQTAASLDPEDNRARLPELIGAAQRDDAPTLVVLPEAYARDFGPPDGDLAEFAESLDGPFVTTLDDAARAAGVTAVAGMFRTAEEGGLPYNTLVVRGSTEATYDKVHLYDSFGYRESDRMRAGAWTPVVVELGGLKVGLMTCYDLRFPELARALVDAGAEVLVVPAAWVAGERKVDHWRTLVRARAIENTTYVVAVGQPAPRYSGHSLVVSPLGDVLVEAGNGEDVVEAVLDREDIMSARRLNPSLLNRRG